MKFFYFGCYGQAGHYMRAPQPPKDLEERRAVSDFTETNPWGYKIDGGLCPKGVGQFKAALNYKDGWTAISFWDNTVDTRGGSNSNFIAEGAHTFAEMISFAKHYFPEIMNRFGVQIVEHRNG